MINLNLGTRVAIIFLTILSAESYPEFWAQHISASLTRASHLMIHACGSTLVCQMLLPVNQQHAGFCQPHQIPSVALAGRQDIVYNTLHCREGGMRHEARSPRDAHPIPSTSHPGAHQTRVP